jgi:hypothetical protein
MCCPGLGFRTVTTFAFVYVPAAGSRSTSGPGWHTGGTHAHVVYGIHPSIYLSVDNDGRCSNASSSLCFLYEKVRIQTKPFHVHAFISSSHRTYGTIPGWCVLNHRCSNTCTCIYWPTHRQISARQPPAGAPLLASPDR